MFNIQSFLEKITQNVDYSEKDIHLICQSIEKCTGIQLPPQSIEIKNSIVVCNGSPALKNKLYIYKDSILKEIKSQIQTPIIDIR